MKENESSKSKKRNKDIAIFPIYMNKSIKFVLDELVLVNMQNKNRNTIILECILYGLKHLYNIGNIEQEANKNDR
jgi:hypothetical protein